MPRSKRYTPQVQADSLALAGAIVAELSILHTWHPRAMDLALAVRSLELFVETLQHATPKPRAVRKAGAA